MQVCHVLLLNLPLFGPCLSNEVAKETDSVFLVQSERVMKGWYIQSNSTSEEEEK